MASKATHRKAGILGSAVVFLAAGAGIWAVLPFRIVTDPNDYEKEYQNEQQRYNELYAAHLQVAEKAREFEAANSKAERLLESLKQEVGKVREERDSEQTLAATLRSAVSRLEAEGNERTQEAAELSTRNNDLQKDLEGRDQKLAQSAEELQRRSDMIAQLTKTCQDLTRSLDDYRNRLASIAAHLQAPGTGWVMYGEPCHSPSGWDGRHPAMHNRAFDLNRWPTAEDIQRGTIFTVKEFTTVWSEKPAESDRDEYNVPFIYNEGEWYPPEETAGLLVPGQRVKITHVFPIEYGFTFVQYALLPGPEAGSLAANL